MSRSLQSFHFSVWVIAPVYSECNLPITSKTTCPCREETIAGPCYKPQSDGSCLSIVCKDAWKCECFQPTHMCARTTCTKSEVLTSTPLPSNLDPRCHSVEKERCVERVGEPIRPLHIIMPTPTPTATPTPTPTPSPTPSNAAHSVGMPCDTSKDCTDGWPGEVCVMGKCQILGTCVPEMNKYCASNRPGSQCCDQGTYCAIFHVQGDTSFCGNDCSAECMGRYVYTHTDCAFRLGGARTWHFDTAFTVNSALRACSVIT